ncbi:MAG: dihydroorotase [Pseudomonadota bacterium]
MQDVILTQAVMVNEGKRFEGELLIKKGRIEAIGAHVPRSSNTEIIDLNGSFLLPGMIDDQVHFREPGLTHKGSIGSESRAAVAGGITSYMEMPNVKPSTTTPEALTAKFARAKGRSLANYSFYFGATNDNLQAIQKLDPHAACGIKVFMGASTGNMLVDQPQILEGIFRDAPIIVVTHCEDTPTIAANEAIYRERYGENIPFSAHPDIRSEEACWRSSSMAVDLARRYGTQLHVLHLTTEKELALFSSGAMDKKSITAEVCVHHLSFSAPDYETLGALIKCNPAVKKESDRQALIQAVKNDVIDIIATDHAPHTWDEKQGSYFEAPSGLPLVQHALQATLEFVHNGELTLEQVVNKISHAPAQRFQVKERGFLREGYWADLVWIDMQKPDAIEHNKLLYHCGWSPFEGRSFRSSIISTWVNGQRVWNQGYVIAQALGQPLEFTR